MGYNPLYRGSVSKVPSRAVTTGYQNGTISDMSDALPVSTDINGKITLTDVTDEDSYDNFVGITGILIPSAASGDVIHFGRAEGLTLTGFSLGDNIYVGLNGTLINVIPDYGVAGFQAGHFVIFVGVVVKNEFDPSKKDILLAWEKRGQL